MADAARVTSQRSYFSWNEANEDASRGVRRAIGPGITRAAPAGGQTGERAGFSAAASRRAPSGGATREGPSLRFLTCRPPEVAAAARDRAPSVQHPTLATAGASINVCRCATTGCLYPPAAMLCRAAREAAGSGAGPIPSAPRWRLLASSLLSCWLNGARPCRPPNRSPSRRVSRRPTSS